jgi:hypothetical protein
MEMDIPQPVDVSRLKNILGNAKAVMNKVESGNFKTGSISDSSMLAMGDTEMLSEAQVNAQGGTIRSVQRPENMNVNTGYDSSMIDNSKLPANIKEAMKKYQTQPNADMMANVLNPTFSLSDVADLAEKPMPAPQARNNPNYNPQAPQQMQYQQPQQMQYQQPQMMNENYQQFAGLNEQQIRAVVKDELLNFFGNDYIKIREAAIKSTIQTLINEGKIKTVKKKTVQKRRA